MQYWIIYLYTNTINGKKYIGLTKRGVAKRRYDHIKKAREGKGGAFHSAIRKYGIDAFSLQEIACARTLDDAREAEMALIEQHGSFVSCHGYNLTRGGEFSFFTQDELQKIRERMLGDKNPMRRKDVASKVGKTLRGRPSANRGKKIEAITGERNPFWGKKHTSDSLDKMSSAHRKRYIAIHDDGRREIIDNLQEFCIKNNCSYSGMRHMIADKKNYKSKGFIVLRLD